MPTSPRSERPGERVVDAQALGVGQALADERRVDGERRRPRPGRHPGRAPRWRRAAPRSRPPPARPRRGRPPCPRPAGAPAARRRPRPAPPAGGAAAASPSSATVAPCSASTAASRSANATSGWKLAFSRAGGHGRLEDGRGQQRRWCGRAPGRCTAAGRAATAAIASSGTVRKMRRASSRTPAGSARRRARPAAQPGSASRRPGVAAGDRHHRPAGAPRRRTPRASPTRPAPDEADRGGAVGSSPCPGRPCGMSVAGRQALVAVVGVVARGACRAWSAMATGAAGGRSSGGHGVYSADQSARSTRGGHTRQAPTQPGRRA